MSRKKKARKRRQELKENLKLMILAAKLIALVAGTISVIYMMLQG